MIKGLLYVFLLLQTTPPQNVGNVTGMVRGAGGTPAQGTRVFATAFTDARAAAAGDTSFAGLTQTDASGKYRMELPPGRYLIATGSIAVPVYFPGTTDIARARPVTVTSGADTTVDFAGLAPAAGDLPAANLPAANPAPASLFTTISGTIHFSDGTPARNVEVRGDGLGRSGPVRVAPINPLPGLPGTSNATPQLPLPNVLRARTDQLGRYRLTNAAPGDYYISSGSAMYPGTLIAAERVAVKVSSTQLLEKMDFTVPGLVLSGRVTAAGGTPAVGAWVRYRSSAMPGAWETQVQDSDGSYKVGGLAPGTYSVEAFAAGASQKADLIVGNEATKTLNFSLPIAMILARILFEDGTPVPDTRVLGNAVITTVGNPDNISSKIFGVSETGTFGGVVEAGVYKIELPRMTPFYNIKSITSAGRDLLKEPLKVTAAESFNIEIRLGK